MGFSHSPFQAKRPNFRPAAVAFSSLASPFFGFALPLRPSATRASLFRFPAGTTPEQYPPQVKREVGDKNRGEKHVIRWPPRTTVKSDVGKTHTGEDKVRNIPMSRTKVLDFFVGV